MDRNCFVHPAGSKFCFCSNCGRVVLQDEYNYEKHAESCPGFAPETGYKKAFKEDTNYGYRLTKSGPHELTMQICKPTMVLIPGFTGRYQGAKWEPIVEVIYKNDGSRKVTEVFNHSVFPYHIWLSLMRQPDTLVPVHCEPDVEIVQSVFPEIYDMYSFQMFDYIFWNKGYNHRPVRISDEKKEIMFKPIGETVSMWEVDNRMILRVELPAEEREDKPVIFLFIGDTVVCNKKRVCYRELFQVEFSQTWAKYFRYFARCYPDSDLAQYMGYTNQTNYLIPLLAGYYHCGLEMFTKAGLTHLAYDMELEYLTKDPSVYRNLKELFDGIPISVLRKVDENMEKIKENMNLEIFLKFTSYLYKRNPAFLQTEWNLSTLYFIRDFCTNGFPELTEGEDQKILRILRYMENLSYLDYTEYHDYLNMCGQLGFFTDGLLPKNVHQAHNNAMKKYWEMKDKEKNRAFFERVHSDAYQYLVQQDDEAEEAPYIILCPWRPEDLDTEGRAMHNCVASYKKAVANGRSKIYFLRQSKAVDQSFGTIEVQERTLVQAKAFANRHLPISAQIFVRDWCKKNGLRISTCDLSESA